MSAEHEKCSADFETREFLRRWKTRRLQAGMPALQSRPCGFPQPRGDAVPVTGITKLDENLFAVAAMTSPYLKRLLVLAGVVMVAVTVSSFRPNRPRPLSLEEVPIAFWSWRTRVPNQAELEESFAPTHAKTLFLRTGQFEIEGDKVQRIRSVTGTLPTRVETHFVYNATRKFLGEFERLDIPTTAQIIAETYRDDLKRANADRANVLGFQLDFDVPSRLLPKYAELLESLRHQLPRDTKISLTGLPAWTASDDISLVLAQVDFWIPQFYGGDFPTHANERIPIASPADVARSTARVRQLGKPFFAGLPAYGYAIVYGKDGSLIELRGNIDPAAVARHADLELIDQRSFDESGSPANTRYEYRATRDLVVVNGLSVRNGETLVLDIPDQTALRAEVLAVRENAGGLLTGICIFRLPAADDRMILSPKEIAAAL